MAPKAAVTPHLFDPLPGQFAIRTLDAGSFVKARLGGGTEVDALITPSQLFDGTARFTFEGYLSPPTHIKTLGGYYVIAFGGGGINGSGNTGADALTFNTFNTVLPADNWGFFEIHGPDSTGLFTFTTITGNFVTAVGGGGHSTQAFHTDAVKAAAWEQFYITKVGDLGSLYYYAIRPVFGVYEPPNYNHYLSATSGGGLITGNAIQQVYELGITTTFRLVLLGNGLYALKTSNGVNYVTADQGGGLAHGSSAAGNLQTNRTVAQSWEQFEIAEVGDGTYSIKTFSGFLIGVDPSGDISTRIGSVAAAPTIGYTARFELVMVNPA